MSSDRGIAIRNAKSFFEETTMAKFGQNHPKLPKISLFLDSNLPIEKYICGLMNRPIELTVEWFHTDRYRL